MKKLTNIILIIALLLNILMPVGAVQAAAPRAVINITAPATALRGQEVLVAVSMDVAANANIVGFSAEFTYSDGFPAIISDNTKIVENTLGWSGDFTAINKNIFVGLGSSNAEGGTVVGQLAFKIPENAEFGTVYTVSFSTIDISDSDANPVLESDYKVENSSVSIEVVDLPPVEGISVTEYQGVFDGEEHTISVDIPDGATIRYSDDASTYEDEIPTFVNAGEHRVYYVVSKEGFSDTYGNGKVSITPKSLEDSMIDTISPEEYTGSQITPEITLTDGNPNLITENDYTVSYGDNINVADGGTVTVNGKGNYTGSADATFDILPIVMDVTEVDYEGIFDGNAHSAQVTVNEPSNAVVMYGTEEGSYTLETAPQYTNAGTYTVFYKATAENYTDYTGSVKVVINPKTITQEMIADIASYDYTGSQITPDVTVSDQDPSIITANDYTISYGENINVADGGSVIVEGKGNYTGRAEKSFVINPVAMTVTASDFECVYDGQLHGATLDVEIPETATVKYGTTQGSYTESEMPKYKDVGEYTVYYKVSDPNYIETTGSVLIKITPKELTSSMVADIPDMSYTGSKIEPTVTVTDGDPSIITENDYTVSYGNNLNVAEGGSVTVEAKGNYTGTVNKTFNITPIEMTVSASDYEGVFDGEYHSASYTVTNPENALIEYGLVEGTYDLDTMPSFKDVGEYTVYYKATAQNYIDNIGTLQVKITPKAVSEDMISDIADYAYTGSQIIPEFTVTDQDPSIITENDYTVSYGENVNVADGGSVTITGKGNYTGTATKNFTITPIDMTVEAVGYEGVYDGVNHTVSIAVSDPGNAQIAYGTVEDTFDQDSAPQYKNAGEYTVYYKVTAENYNDVTGSLTVKINPKTLTLDMLENITAQEFTGAQITPPVTMRDTAPCEITADDYTVSYGSNITVSEGGSVTVEGKGNYTGTITKQFEIANAIIRTEKEDYTGVYDGQSHSGSVTVTNCDTAQIMYGSTEGVYDLSQMPEFTNAGNYVVYYKASAENYSDATGSLEVNIAPKELTEAMVGDVESHTYTSLQITPEIAVTDEELITSEDYDITYGENVTVTTGGTVTVTAKRNYTGTVTKSFEIAKADLNITSESKEITYGDTFEIPVVYSGFVGSETKDNLISQAVVTGFDASPDAGVYNIVLSGAQSDNYNIIYGTDYTLTVNKKNVTVTNLGVFDKAYDETTDALINETTAVLEGIISGDVGILDLTSATATFASSEVGDGISVEITGLLLGGEDGNNYQLTQDTFTTTASIKQTITTSEIAAQITNLVIDKNITSLVLPTVPDGFTISLKSSSDETLIDLNEVIYTRDEAANAELVFTISNEDGTDSTDTQAITATVPAHDKYQITVSAESHGSVSGGGEYIKNSQATVTATADAGYNFNGWYNGDTLVSSSSSYTFTVTENLNLVAKFAVEYVYSDDGGRGSATTYTVMFVTNGGTKINSIKVNENAKIDKLPVTEKEGFTFVGWYTDKDLTEEFDVNSTITKTVTLYAKWEAKTEEPEPEEPSGDEIAFADVEKAAWYYDAVKYVVEKGLFNGVSDTEFVPNSPLTRAMLVTVLYRAEEQPQTDAKQLFVDVEDGKYYSDAVIWASQNGIVTGVSENEFMPDNNITREQIATIIYRYAKFKGLDTENVTADIEYADKAQISDWALDAVAFCKAMSIMTGNDVNEFMPLANATRAEVAATLQRFFEAE